MVHRPWEVAKVNSMKLKSRVILVLFGIWLVVTVFKAYTVYLEFEGQKNQIAEVIGVVYYSMGIFIIVSILSLIMNKLK